MPKLSLLAAALLSLWGTNARANPEIDALRAEIQQMRAHYETRLADLENRLKQAAPAAPAPELETLAANSANPEISLILQGGYSRLKPGERRPTGFLRDAGIGSPARGFSLDDSELILAASIDPYFRGLATVVLADGAAEIEEAWFQTQTLGNGLTLKGGRFISGIGYQNEQHPHAWDFADNNLMYQTLFGEHLVQDGLQLKWLAPSETFLEFGVEAGRGGAFPGSEAGGDRNGPGAWALFGHVGGDVGDSSAWRAGLSYTGAHPKDRESRLHDSGGSDDSTLFTGESRTWIADLVWKWAPEGNPKSRNFKFQTEYFRRDETGALTCLDPDPTTPGDPCDGDPAGAYRAGQSGWYAQGVYQFMPRWRVGLRYDRLNRGSLDYGANNAFLLPAEYHPNRWSLMTDYAPSEFSLLRLQLSRDHAMQGDPDNSQILLQYIHSLGPHGAHKF